MNAGVALYELNRFEESLVELQRALELAPRQPDVLLNLANTLAELGRHENALAALRAAIDVRPRDAQALMNLGNLLRDTHRHDDALAAYEQSLAVDPKSVETRWNRALCLLAKGDFERGWPAFEARLESASMTNLTRRFAAPLWCGEPVARHVVLVHAEQGLGDTLQFSRFASALAQQGATVLLEAPRALAGVLRSLDQVTVVTKDVPPPHYDFHVPLLSLPGRLRMHIQSITGATGYLRADAELQRSWAPFFAQRTGLKLGLAWSGNAAYRHDHRRSVSLQQLLASLPDDAQWWSLQKDMTEQDASLVVGHTLEPNDFDHTAAQISHLDVVVSVDTSIAHLAASMGKPTCLLLAHVADWRWAWARDDSPWYSSVRIFRQPAPGDWAGALGALATHLSALASRPQ